MGRALRRIHEASLHSAMYRWMLENRETFAAQIAAAGRPDWSRIAELLAEDGLTDASGNPPTRSTARHTWWKVRGVAGSAAPVAAEPELGPPAGRETTSEAVLLPGTPAQDAGAASAPVRKGFRRAGGERG